MTNKLQLILIYTLVFLHLVMFTTAQNIGINTTGATPNASAMLDISATNKGVLITRVSLTSTTDVTTIANPATSLLVYNTNGGMAGGGVGFYYWNSTAWTKLNDGSVSNSNSLWTANGNNISNANAGYVGIGTNTPFVPLHIKGQRAITLPNGGIETSHVTTLINDTTPASGTGSKIGLYAIVKNHAAANVGILAEAITKDNTNNFGIIGNIIGNGQTGGMAYAIGAVDAVKNGTGALYMDGEARYAGVPNTNEAGTIITNSGNGTMKWSKPAVFRLTNTIRDTIQVGSSKRVRFSNQPQLNTGSYNSSTGELTITEAGFYHLTVNYGYFIIGPTTKGETGCQIMRNGTYMDGAAYYQRFVARVVPLFNIINTMVVDIYNTNTAGDIPVVAYSVDAYLNIGDVITLLHFNSTDGRQMITSDNSFSGFIVR